MPGITRSMPSSSSSALSVSDALANLTKAATVALNVVQGAQEQANGELARLRDERDDALKGLRDAQLDVKELEVRQEGWKAALEKSDLTIKHHTETIAQLRAEVSQWKTQLNRLEESSRQEIDGWKDQYRRAEHERSRLSVRIEELIAGQLAWNAAAHAYTAPFTPRTPYAHLEDPSTSSSATKRASTSHSHRAATPHAHARAPAEDEVPPTTTRKSRAPHSSRGTNRADSRSRNGSPSRVAAGRRKENLLAADAPQASGSRATPRTPAAARATGAHAQGQTQPRQQLIRRVTAVVDVKEEEETDGELDELESAASGSVYEPDDQPPIPPGPRRRRASYVPARSKRSAEGFDDEEESLGRDEEDGEMEDEEGEDDELLLGPKTQMKKPPRGPSGGTRPSRASGGTKPAKKRKIDTDGGASSGRAGPTKSAKTR
ncbi:hypothetical protein C8Q80DRAFT_418586 [Daedaleopsis nitida]|nr:hypothetical protein C8Q80DRAFT_418586 [Daedaleopsis nitida]